MRAATQKVNAIMERSSFPFDPRLSPWAARGRCGYSGLSGVSGYHEVFAFVCQYTEVMNGDDDEIVGAFLGENSRADELRELKEILQTRLRIVTGERDGLPPGDGGRVALEKKVRELKEQVRVLAQEEAVSGFVEESVRATLARPESGDLGEDDDGGPY